MNISPQLPSLPIATIVNPATETLRRENNQREVIVKPEAAAQSAAEKGVASEKERARTPAQNNEQVDFANIRKRAEQENTTISDSSEQGEGSESREQPQQSSSEKSGSEIFAEEKIIHELKQRDTEVRSHERAHAAVGGATTGSPSFSFETGPDGKKYAIGGEVSVDLSRIKGNPRATIAKMQKVHAAALAPANPSIQDTRVAASAARIITQAQSELLSTDIDTIKQAPLSVRNIKPNDVFAKDDNYKSNAESNEFDTLINQTLEAQESVSPDRSPDITERATRIENFYFNINQAYEKAPTHQFELTA